MHSASRWCHLLEISSCEAGRNFWRFALPVFITRTNHLPQATVACGWPVTDADRSRLLWTRVNFTRCERRFRKTLLHIVQYPHPKSLWKIAIEHGNGNTSESHFRFLSKRQLYRARIFGRTITFGGFSHLVVGRSVNEWVLFHRVWDSFAIIKGPLRPRGREFFRRANSRDSRVELICRHFSRIFRLTFRCSDIDSRNRKF